MNHNWQKTHQAEWNEEKIKRFWDYASSDKFRNEQYFSKEAGKEIINFAMKFTALEGNILDYGCGPGYLITYLIDKKISCKAADSSVKSLTSVDEKFKNNRFFQGTILTDKLPLPIMTNSTDFIFFVETLEHLLPIQIPPLLKEFNRILKNGGKLLITVPNDENLDKNKHICPDCGCVFHRMQHINSFNKESLSSLLNEYGFTRLFCGTTTLTGSYTIKLKIRIKNLLGIKYKKPHLIYIGEKII